MKISFKHRKLNSTNWLELGLFNNSVRFTLNNRKMILTGAMTALSLLLLYWSDYPVWILPGFVVSFLFLIGLEVTPGEGTPRWWTALTNGPLNGIGFLKKMTVTWSNMLSWIWTAILIIFGSWFSVWCMQRVILEKDLYAKTGKTAFRQNVLCVLILYIVMLLIFARTRWAWIVSHTLIVIIAFADYFVYEFRQNEIVFADFDTLGTGLSVAKNYNFQLHARGAVVIMLSILAFTLILKFRFRFRHPILIRIALLALAMYLVPFTWGQIKGRITQTWEKKGTYRNGFIVNFILGIRDSHVDAPAGYSAEEIEALEDEYRDRAADQEEPEVKPTIITIMNESFADFRLVGDLKTNMEVTPFLDSLKENTTRGYAMTSVFGAKTPNSEWEYLSGHSMGFMPGGSVVYQQFMDETPTTLVSSLKNLGYTAVAMHPYFAAGWRRNTVYPKMGFDEMKFMDTGDFDETQIMREYITDQEMFDKLIERYEQKAAGEPLFIMGVTMQNHGGYKELYDNFRSDVYQIGSQYYADASQYLSLIHQTDMAMQNLIEYFSGVDEPVEIVFFGDHYPSLDSGFVRSLNKKGVSGLTLSELENLFSVPFFIWTNYDSDEEEIERTSLNFLGTLALKKAGLPLPAYNLFLSDLNEVIPAMNIRGYFSKMQNKFIHLSDAAGEERSWLRKYRYLQYNSIFDLDHRSTLFFPYIVTEEEQ